MGRHRYTVLYATGYQDSYDGPEAGSRQVLAESGQAAWNRVWSDLEDAEPEDNHTLVGVIAGWKKLLPVRD